MIEQHASEDKILESAICYVKKAGKMVEELMKKPLKWKEKVNHSDLVTEVDVQIEAFLCEIDSPGLPRSLDLVGRSQYREKSI